MRTSLALCLFVSSCAAYAAQDGDPIVIEPTAVDSYVVRFVGRTLVSTTVTCTTIKGTDASPSNIVSGSPSVSGTDVTFRLSPGAGRKGNSYHCKVQPLDSADNQPIANIRVDVRQTVIVP